MGGLDGRVAFITGIGRGQGRAHALRLARDGADIIGVDICAPIGSMNYPNSTDEDLTETVRLVEALDRRIVARKADVRNFAELSSAFQAGLAELGRVDIIVANAGILRLSDESDDFLADWQDVIDTNLTGVFNTIRTALPAMREAGRGGSIVITSSAAAMKATGSLNASPLAYAAAKRGVVGLMQNLATALGPEWIRVNTIHPTGVRSGMSVNEVVDRLMAESAQGKRTDISTMQNLLPISLLEPEEVANAVGFLVSDEAKFITGVQWPLDAGCTAN